MVEKRVYTPVFRRKVVKVYYTGYKSHVDIGKKFNTSIGNVSRRSRLYRYKFLGVLSVIRNIFGNAKPPVREGEGLKTPPESLFFPDSPCQDRFSDNSGFSVASREIYILKPRFYESCRAQKTGKILQFSPISDNISRIKRPMGVCSRKVVS